MGDGDIRRLFLLDDLHLFVKLRAIGFLGSFRACRSRSSKSLLHHFGIFWAAFAGTRTSAQEEEVVGIAVVAGPAKERHLVLALLRPFAVLAPLIRHKLAWMPTFSRSACIISAIRLALGL